MFLLQGVVGDLMDLGGGGRGGGGSSSSEDDFRDRGGDGFGGTKGRSIPLFLGLFLKFFTLTGGGGGLGFGFDVSSTACLSKQITN